MNMEIHDIFLLFGIYAILGWMCEVAYVTLKRGVFENRGFLNGPLCPIYGFGAMGVVLMFHPIEDHILLLFAASALLCSALEFIAGVLLEKLFHNTWWDYSDQPFNIHGYICLRMSILWGFACVTLVRVLHPVVYAGITHLPVWLTWVLAGIFYAYLIGDLIVTVRGISNVNRGLQKMATQLHEVSDRTGLAISEAAANAGEKGDELKEELEERKERITRRRDAVIAFMSDPSLAKHRRLFKAFPHMRHQFVERTVSIAGEEFREQIEKRIAAMVEKRKNM